MSATECIAATAADPLRADGSSPRAAPAMLPWLVTASAPFALAASAFAVIAPLWAAAELGAAPADWARLNGLRFVGTLVGSILIGVLSARFAPRGVLIAALSLCTLVVCGLARGVAVAWLMPVLGAAVSAAYVGFNSLVQSSPHQGRANAWYRGVGAVAGVAAPLGIMAVATACGSFATALAALALAFALATLLMIACPSPPRVRGSGSGWRGYVGALTHPPLLRFMLLAEGASAAGLALIAFAALRLVTRLAMPELTFAACAGIAGALGIAVITLLGRLCATRQASSLLGVLAGISGLASAGFAAIDHALGAAVAFIVATAATTAWGVPLAFGLTRRSGAIAHDCVFAAHKTLQALMIAATMAVLAALEPRLGMAGVIALCSCVSAGCAIALGRLHQREEFGVGPLDVPAEPLSSS